MQLQWLFVIEAVVKYVILSVFNIIKISELLVSKLVNALGIELVRKGRGDANGLYVVW